MNGSDPVPRIRLAEHSDHLVAALGHLGAADFALVGGLAVGARLSVAHRVTADVDGVFDVAPNAQATTIRLVSSGIAHAHRRTDAVTIARSLLAAPWDLASQVSSALANELASDLRRAAAALRRSSDPAINTVDESEFSDAIVDFLDLLEA